MQEDNYSLKNESMPRLSKIGDFPKSSNEAIKETDVMNEVESPKGTKLLAVDADKTSATIDKSPLAINQSVCTSVTVDMDMSEEEMTKLREENQVLRKQLEFLRVNHECRDIIDDQDYDDSVVPESQSSTTEYISDTNDVPDAVLKQICSEVEMVTEEVIIKTRAESESRISKLQQELEEAKAELERAGRLAKYDLDDMNRVNRSLREDLEAFEQEKRALLEELDEKTEEFDALNEDVERFAETFAAQHDEVQHLERITQKLEAENQKLKESDVYQRKRIEELEDHQESTKNSASKNDGGNSAMALTEITKLWQEVARLRQSPSVGTDGSSREDERRRRRQSSDSFSSNDESSDGGDNQD